MINDDKVIKGTTDIIHIKADLLKILSVGRDDFLSDKKNSLAVKYLLIEAVEAISDICQHVLAKARGVVCSGYVDCIVKTGEQGIIQSALANKLRKLADLRNSLIHRYWIINDEELFQQCSANIDDFSDFTMQMHTFLSSTEGK